MKNPFNVIKKTAEQFFGSQKVNQAEQMADSIMANMLDEKIGYLIDNMVESMLKDAPEARHKSGALRREILNEFVHGAKTGEEPNIERALYRAFGEEFPSEEQRRPTTLREMAHTIAADMQCLSRFEPRTAEEVTELGKNIPFRILKDPTQFVQWARTNRVALRDAHALLAWAGKMKDFLAGIDPDGDVTYDEVQRAADLAQTQSIILHRVNYLLHEQMLTVYDLLERDKKLRFLPKKHYRTAEDCWTCYERPRQRMTERTAWCTLQDCLRIAADTLQPRLQRVYETARDRMIFLGVKDVELRSRIVVALAVGKVQHLSFHQFFDDFRRDLHCDMRRLFAQDDLLPMTRAFADMVQALGIAVITDEYGLPSLADFDIDSSVRTGWAWKSFMKDLRDVDLMDETARQAIDLNPRIQQDYLAVLQQAEEERRQQEQEEMTSQLAKKYKVTKL